MEENNPLLNHQIGETTTNDTSNVKENPQVLNTQKEVESNNTPQEINANGNLQQEENSHNIQQQETNATLQKDTSKQEVQQNNDVMQQKAMPQELKTNDTQQQNAMPQEVQKQEIKEPINTNKSKQVEVKSKSLNAQKPIIDKPASLEPSQNNKSTHSYSVEMIALVVVVIGACLCYGLYKWFFKKDKPKTLLDNKKAYETYKSMIKTAICEQDYATLEELSQSRATTFIDLAKMMQVALKNRNSSNEKEKNQRMLEAFDILDELLKRESIPLESISKEIFESRLKNIEVQLLKKEIKEEQEKEYLEQKAKEQAQENQETQESLRQDSLSILEESDSSSHNKGFSLEEKEFLKQQEESQKIAYANRLKKDAFKILEE
ncbi:hypothetical protein [Helicobacter cetorum]|uniref:hypothetical protein n=1 Tax=Helicobacter cetorum TaxID=138563 RepID=UPI000CF0D0A5|nr:hypothetical protein [Helicobacter cetorum]